MDATASFRTRRVDYRLNCAIRTCRTDLRRNFGHQISGETTFASVPINDLGAFRLVDAVDLVAGDIARYPFIGHAEACNNIV